MSIYMRCKKKTPLGHYVRRNHGKGIERRMTICLNRCQRYLLLLLLLGRCSLTEHPGTPVGDAIMSVTAVFPTSRWLITRFSVVRRPVRTIERPFSVALPSSAGKFSLASAISPALMGSNGLKGPVAVVDRDPLSASKPREAVALHQ